MIRRGMGVASAVLAIGLAAGWMENAVHSSPTDAVRTSSRFVMIQGRVDQVSKGWATVTTLAWQPYCPPRRMCPMIVMAGRVYQVRLAGATADNASGLPWSGSMQAGESVVIAGNLLSHRNGSPRTSTPAGVPVVPMQARIWDPLSGSSVREPSPCWGHIPHGVSPLPSPAATR